MSDKKQDQNFFSTKDEYDKDIDKTPEKKYILDEGYSKYLDYEEASDSTLNESQNLRNTENETDDENIQSKSRERKESFIKRNNYKNLKIILLSVLVAIIALFGIGVAYMYHITNGADYGDHGIDYNHDSDIVEDEDLDLKAMGDVTDASSLNDFLYSWSNNGGDLMHSKNVLNILLCGVDSKDGTASSGRADAIILVSVNKKTKTITLSSFFRDSYIYMDIPKKDGTSQGRYEKLNAAYQYGGPASLLNTIEKNFKIEIDQYIAVDFSSFTKLIDALGGVTVDVEEREALYIRRTSSHKSFPYGNDVKLTGSQALVYSRIRYLDSDINRTERQRKVIKSLVNSAKTATSGQLVNAYKQTAKYIRTGYSQTEVISLIATAVAQNWMSFKLEEYTYPAESGVEMASAYVDTTSARRQWVWIVDYPLCAQKLQMNIYGESNINLSADRVSPLDFTNAKKGSSGSSSSGGSSSNNYTTTTTRSKISTTTSSTSSTEYSSTESTNSTSPTDVTDDTTIAADPPVEDIAVIE